MKAIWFITILVAMCLAGCYTITVKFEPLPVVLSWGGETPDNNLVNSDGGVTHHKLFLVEPKNDHK